MAGQLGFYVIEMGAQFIGHQPDEDDVLEVRNELGFTDLTHGNGPSLRVSDRLPKLAPSVTRFASQWQQTALTASIAPNLSRLARRNIAGTERIALLNEIRTANRDELGNSGGW